MSLIVRVNVVLNRTVVVDSDRRFYNLCGVVIFRVKVSCITSVDGIIFWFSYVLLLLGHRLSILLVRPVDIVTVFNGLLYQRANVLTNLW